ncbi:MAG: SctK family type III secretion system sorting platform protein [Methylacidiphilaceae bacterium]|nr:SctK family type III secretion system sorting platform protein [Candidatus Methylacidiphilaceae bacterium]
MARRALVFNFLPSRYAHPSHCEPLLPPPLRKRLERTSRGEAELSRLILSAHGMLGKWQSDFLQGNCRLALAYSDLRRLAHYAGAFFHAEAIWPLVEKKRIAEIKARIGPDAYEFAVRRATLFRKWRPFDPPPFGGDLAEAIEKTGRLVLEACFARTGLAIEGRLRLLWPADDPCPWSAAAPGPAEAEAAGLFLKHLFCREFAPEWRSFLF